MKFHECWAMLLLALIFPETILDACASLELGSANATGTGSVRIAAQAAASPDVATDSASERYRPHPSESPKTLDLMGFSRSQENKVKFDSRNAEDSQRITSLRSSTWAAAVLLPNTLKFLKVQTTFFSRVTSKSCGFSGPAWQLPTIRLPFGKA